MRKDSMFQKEIEFANIFLAVDPINRPRSEDNDNAMAIFYEEQPLMWKMFAEKISSTIKTANGSIDFLDIGTGSGVWSILIAKHIPEAKNILAIDKSRRAIKMAEKNAIENKVKFKLKNEFYNISTAPYQSCKVIGIYAPYHLYPPDIELNIPQHARGGIDGQQVFKEQLISANYHLARDGIIIFNQMCLGRKNFPEFTHYIKHLIPGSSLEFLNIFPAISTKIFLKNVYGNSSADYVKKISSEYPQLFYCNGIIKKNGNNSITELPMKYSLQGRTWEDRIAIHKELVKLSREEK